jgi:hypothetical protein
MSSEDPARTWLDLTIRPGSTPEVDVQPDGTVEISATLGECAGSRVTLLLSPDAVRRLEQSLSELLLLGRIP